MNKTFLKFIGKDVFIVWLASFMMIKDQNCVYLHNYKIIKGEEVSVEEMPQWDIAIRYFLH